MRATQTKPDERDDHARRDGRQIVVCCDGTSNTLSAGVRDTNVVRLVEMLSDPVNRDGDGPVQLVYYDPGVGVPVGLPPTGVAGSIIEPARRTLGLALGRGIYENIAEAYLFLSREYGRHADEGQTTADEIFIFGFSRGAFTARCVAGMVSLFGLVRAEHEHLLPTLLSVYFASPHPPARVRLVSSIRGQVLGKSPALVRQEIADQVRDLFTTPAGAGAHVHFLGVWDTVASVGVPGLRRKISSTNSLEGKRIMHVRHALSIDEHRHPFLPRYFSGPLSPGQTLGQRWFRGVHTDVGGGRRTPMADEAFAWMVLEAQAQGLAHTGQVDDRSVRVLKNWPIPERVLGDQLYVTPWWSLAGMAVRDPAPGWSGEGEWVKGGRLQDNPPLEHESVDDFSPKDGGVRGPTREHTLTSPWEGDGMPRTPRRWWAVGIWAILSVAATIISGLVVDQAPTDAGDSPLLTGFRVELALLTGVLLEGQLVDPRGPAGPAWPNPGWAILLSSISLAGWSYVAARLATRWFA
ncbi:MAG: DUF2235 domain-containing protein, partial [Solirubrobacteraceae bacterium]|nr:DUF2235 domain-containing protein [Solirubrobacteraceae bacterium]